MAGLQTAYFEITVIDEKQLPLRDFISDGHIKEISMTHKAAKKKAKTSKKGHGGGGLGSASIHLVNLSYEQVELGMIQEGRVLNIAWGVTGAWRLDRDYIIKEIKTKYGLSISATLELRDYKTKMFERKAGKSWHKKTSSAIVSEIAAHFQLAVDIEETETPITVAQGMRSYAAVLHDLAYLEGYYWDIIKDTLVFKPLYESEESKGVRTWWVHGPDRLPGIMEFDIVTTARHINLSASNKKKKGEKTTADSDGQLESEGGGNDLALEKVVGVQAEGLDIFSGEVAKGDANAEDTPAIGDGNVHMDITYFGDGTFTDKEVTGEVDTHPANSEEAGAVAKKRAKAAAMAAKFSSKKATMVMKNQPVEPHQVYNIRGVASMHAGMYKVHSLTVKVGGGEVVNQIELMRDTGGKKKGAKPKTTTPESDASPDSSSDEADVDTVTYNEDGSFTEN